MDQFNWKNVWQVACGDGSRDYRNLFLNFGLIAVGASDDVGPFNSDLRPYDNSECGDAARKIRPVAAAMNSGDTIILKKGKSIVSVGQVVGPYKYDGRSEWPDNWSNCDGASSTEASLSQSRLDDVDGWDLRHTRTVKWWKNSDDMGCGSLTRATVSRVKSDNVKQAARKYLEGANAVHKTKELKSPAKLLTNEDVLLWLMGRGLSSERSEVLSNRLQTLQRLARWYQDESIGVSEHEIRAYLVWPLLQALGWSEQCVKFEYKNMDLAVYAIPVTVGTTPPPAIIIETKKLFSGLSPALDQARYYADQNSSAGHVLATDGVRYLVQYECHDLGRKQAYMNLLRLRDTHPYDEDLGGAPNVLAQLLRF